MHRSFSPMPTPPGETVRPPGGRCGVLAAPAPTSGHRGTAAANDREVLVLTRTDVQSLLSMSDCIGLMHDVLVALARGQAVQPMRALYPVPGGILAAMPGALAGSGSGCGAKVMTGFDTNQGTALDVHQGVVLLFSPSDGRLLAIVDASSVTAIRTAAVSAVATRYLARAESTILALLGTGTQAESHIEAMARVRPIREVRVCGRSSGRAEAFAQRWRERLRVKVDVRVAREAVRGADIVCTTTSSAEPVLQGAWLEPGMHINAVGASRRDARELDSEAVARSTFFFDRRESVLAESGAFLMARAAGAVTDTHLAGEIGDVMMGTARGRLAGEQITLFQSLGLAVEDIATASYLYHKALHRGQGTRLAWLGDDG